jgi:hypothetical protein
MYEAKEGTHPLYKAFKSLPSGDPRADELVQRIQGIHEDALAEADPVWKALLGNAGRP